ncbi:MAG: hypothetical protein JO314_06255 [Acidobacteria bacterium]|nr:hypothetical protein [Acidobacteriota bacterium]
MKFIGRNSKYIAVALVTLLVGIAAANMLGQETKFKDKFDKLDSKNRGFCNNNNWSSDDHVTATQLREMTVAAGGTLTVDGRQNGGVSVLGENRSDILVRACVQAWGKSDEDAKARGEKITINTSGTIKAEGPEENGWSVSFQILAPRNTSVDLTAHNGGISIQGIDGSAKFETMNGGVFLSDDAGNFSGKTQNGGVFVRLNGSSWKGGGLDVTTTNGGVNIEMPENYAAHVETSTVNGGFSSDIAALQPLREDRDRDDNGWGYRSRKTKINTDLNGGGPPVRVVTTNGGVRISTPGTR